MAHTKIKKKTNEHRNDSSFTKFLNNLFGKSISSEIYFLVITMIVIYLLKKEEKTQM